jgi:hypothetical protein
MEKKKRRRRNSEVIAEDQTEVQETAAHKLVGAERFNEMAHVQDGLVKDAFHKVSTKYWLMTDAELVAASKNKEISQVERALISQIETSRSKANRGHANSAFSDGMDRLFGKSKQSLELSGPDGSSIKVDTQAALTEYKENVSKLTPAELDIQIQAEENLLKAKNRK